MREAAPAALLDIIKLSWSNGGRVRPHSLSLSLSLWSAMRFHIFIAYERIFCFACPQAGAQGGASETRWAPHNNGILSSSSGTSMIWHNAQSWRKSKSKRKSCLLLSPSSSLPLLGRDFARSIRQPSQANYLRFYEVLILCRTFNGLTLARRRRDRSEGEGEVEGSLVVLTVNEVYLWANKAKVFGQRPQSSSGNRLHTDREIRTHTQTDINISGVRLS